MDQCVITREITVAAGVFAPGHLGELTRIVPFDMVDEALEATGTAQARVRVLPSRVVVYLLLAGCLFEGLGYRQVRHKLTAGLSELVTAQPSDNALWQARARLGAAPLRWLSDLLRGPATAITAGTVRWHGLVVCGGHPSRPTVAGVRPSGLNAIAGAICLETRGWPQLVSGEWMPSGGPIWLPVVMYQRRMVPSSLIVASVASSGMTAMLDDRS